MFFAKDLTGIPVMDGKSGKMLGRVHQWLTDKKGEYIIGFVLDPGGWFSFKKTVPYSDVLNISEDAIVIMPGTVEGTEDLPLGENSFQAFGKRVLSHTGEELGVVEDILFDGSTGKIAGWRLSSGLIDDLVKGRPLIEPAPEFSIGEVFIIVPEEAGNFQQEDLQ